MGKKNLDWGNLPFGYMKTSKSFVANYKNGEWDEGKLTSKHGTKFSALFLIFFIFFLI